MFGCPGGDGGSRPQPQLVETRGDVIAGRALREAELGGDLAVGAALGDERRCLHFAAGKFPRQFVEWWSFRDRNPEQIGFLGESLHRGLFERPRASLV
jgi:hypothetical protein